MQCSSQSVDHNSPRYQQICSCCMRQIVCQEAGVWSCWFCDVDNIGSWRCSLHERAPKQTAGHDGLTGSWLEEIQKLRKRLRPKQALWRKFDYAKHFPQLRSQIIAEVRRIQTVARFHRSTLSLAEFHSLFELTSTPVVVSGMTDDWPGAQDWTQEALAQGKHKDLRCKCESDLCPYTTRLSSFAQYQKQDSLGDDNPLYIFHSDVTSKLIKETYTIPKYFPRSYLSSLGPDRPPFSYFLIGPQRSGTLPHVDPFMITSWNTVVTGLKWWVMFPPDTPEDIVEGHGLFQPGEDRASPIVWFLRILPRIRDMYCSPPSPMSSPAASHMSSLLTCPDVPPAPPVVEILEFLSGPGEMVHIPSGWWHAVLNLDNAVAMSESVCSDANFPAVWADVRSRNVHMAAAWLSGLLVDHPAVARRACALDKANGFTSLEATTDDDFDATDFLKRVLA